MALPALIALADGAAPSPSLQARALGVSTAFLPEAALFAEGWQSFERERLTDTKRCAARRVCGAARALWLERGRAEPEPTSDDRAPDHWDLARVLRRLERNLVQAGLLVRRARWLRLLADATLAFREQDRAARALIISRGKIVETFDISDVSAIAQLPDRRCSPLGARSACFDRAAYDRMRVLATELRRVHDDGGDAAIRLGAHLYVGERLARLLGEV